MDPRPHPALLAAALAFAACDLLEPEPTTTAPRPAASQPATTSATTTAPSRDGWNTAQIAWLPYDDALARARAEHKPVCLVLHADWCPHCRNYSHVFEDPRVVARARAMEMVLLNVDQAPAIASRYELDGSYVPRTYFLAPDGTPMTDIDAARPDFRYFFPESDQGPLVAAMDRALARR